MSAPKWRRDVWQQLTSADFWREVWQITTRQHPAFRRDERRLHVVPSPEVQRAVRRYLLTSLCVIVALAVFLVYSTAVWGWR